MKKQLETEIKKSHKQDYLNKETSLIKAVTHDIKKSSKYKDLSDDEIQKIIRKRLEKRRRSQVKRYEEQTIDEIVSSNPINELFEYHLTNNDKNKFKTLLVLYKYLELEDENKKLTLTQEQYQTWLETNDINQYITTKQFEVLYGLSTRQQKSLRSKIDDPLPCFKLTENSNILYKRLDVEKWLENYTGKMKL